MKILLTGSRGQVGWEVCRQANEFGISVIATHSDQLDIADAASVNDFVAASDCQFLVNAAAYTAVDTAEDEPERAHAVNADGAGNLARAAASKNVPIVHLSTDYVFRGDASVPYTENAPRDPAGTYGKTKMAGEDLVADLADQHITLRTSWVFGVEGNNFVKTMLRLAGEREELTVVADQYGCPTFAGHIARAILGLASTYRTRGELDWGTYNFCDAGPTTWHGFTQKIVQAAALAGLIERQPSVKPILTSEFPTRAERPAYAVLDCNRFRTAFPEIGIASWEDGLKTMIGELKAAA